MGRKNSIAKKATATIKNWQLHTLSVKQEMIDKVYPGEGLTPLIVSGTVVSDDLGRFLPGHHMRSSLIKKHDRAKGIIETRNTIYKLEGKENGDVLPNLGDNILNVFYD